MDPIEPVMDGERTVLLETIKNRIKYIIQSVETLLENDGILQIAGALYIHAVEEHGKYLYVELLSSNNGIVEVERLHFTSHVFKIELAKEDLPQNCFILKQGIFDPNIFQRGVFDIQEVPDWQTRLTIFNTDLEDGRVPVLPDVNKSDLVTAVSQFKSHLSL